MRVHEKVAKTPKRELETGLEAGSHDQGHVPGLNVLDSFAIWHKDPAYVAAYEAEPINST